MQCDDGDRRQLQRTERAEICKRHAQQMRQHNRGRPLMTEDRDGLRIVTRAAVEAAFPLKTMLRQQSRERGFV